MQGRILVIFLIFALAGCTSQPVKNYYGSYETKVEPKPREETFYSGSKVVVEKTLWVPSQNKTVVHEVAPLETLWRIAKMYGVSVEAIKKANNLSGNDLKIGQKLVIPNAKYFRNIIPLYPNPKWHYIIIHHTGTEIGKAFSIHESHYRRGFINGLGYHFLIDNGTLGKGDGQIEISPRWIKQEDGAHCKAGGMNSVAIGVALVGNFNETQPTKAQLDSLITLVKYLMEYYRIPYSNIMGHRDVPGANTDCPGRLFPWTTVRLALKSF